MRPASLTSNDEKLLLQCLQLSKLSPTSPGKQGCHLTILLLRLAHEPPLMGAPMHIIHQLGNQAKGTRSISQSRSGMLKNLQHPSEPGRCAGQARPGFSQSHAEQHAVSSTSSSTVCKWHFVGAKFLDLQCATEYTLWFESEGSLTGRCGISNPGQTGCTGLSTLHMRS